jgi:hypothetical protein
MRTPAPQPADISPERRAGLDGLAARWTASSKEPGYEMEMG